MLDNRTRDERADRLAQLRTLIETRMPADQQAQVDDFVSAFYANVSAEDILELTVENLYGAALAVWKFAARRHGGSAKVRVYNPHVEEHGWKSPHTIVEIVNADMPFLVDSVTGYLNRIGQTVHLVIHPVIPVTRDEDGRRDGIYVSVSPPKGASNESVMHVQIGEQTDPAVHERIAAELSLVLADVRAAVEDWRQMLTQLDESIDELQAGRLPLEDSEIAETRAFLEWMRDDHFTFLGCRDYTYAGSGDSADVAIISGSGLGILRNDRRHVLTPPNEPEKSDVAPIVRQFIVRPELMLITKTSVRGTVHRSVHMDYIGVKRFDDDGKLVGERRFVGLFTASAYNRTPSDIPLLRRKLEQVLALSGLNPAGHDGKALSHIIETYPRDELFQIDVETLTEIATGILAIQERPHIRLFARRDKFDRFFSLLVFIPRDRLSTELRLRFETILLKSLNSRISSYYTQVGDSPLARIHYIMGINPPGPPAQVDFPAIEQRLIQAARSWHDALYEALVERWGEERAGLLAARYSKAFPAAYSEAFNTELALNDISRLEHIREEGTVALDFYRLIEDGDCCIRFKIFHPGTAVPLSDCLPMLERMGLKVIGETPYRLRFADGDEVWLHDFYMETPDGSEIDLARLKSNAEEAFARVWLGEVENDGFNRLVLRAALEWREVVVLRAYCKYLRQTGTAFSQEYMEDTLAANPGIARKLVRLFLARFDPAAADDRSGSVEGLTAEIEAELEDVDSLDEDRILRRFLNLVQATLRTNHFQLSDGLPKPYLSFKLDSGEVAELPLPRPFREIFVYSPRVEAVHLRGGMVARGGLRWSDRREDFRTEVLGLMKAQMVKNAVIVPVGSKGGFVAKRLPPAGDRNAVMEEVVACYQTFIRGMLDLTDNLKGQDVLHPDDVVRYDDDDSYLVVAADKGTATFSDIANAVAGEYDFWLGDAFASGGAKGYDHKKMAITARGAWESVKRHFREVGRDIQNEDFTVIGIGDMSGDVFGNGMLLSRHIRLQAAFDHRHIFIDPDPEPEASWHERQRLFELPRSSWADYSAELISEGGGVFDRKAKSIAVTPEIRQLARLSADRVTPNELIHALLQAEADLLWFGGIGTYVKAADETDSDAGDRTNDAVRVNGRQLNCKVVGEGANLGVTQRGRIEFALRGGRINTDAVDNSAGVDCSDHEVNIKVLVDAVVADGELTGKQRDRLLTEMTDEVADLCLQDNYLQTQALTVLEHQGGALLESHARLMRQLERAGRLDRTVEFLPDEEALGERGAVGHGLTRPELSVLLAYAKMNLFDALMESDLTDSQALTTNLVKYFPRPLRKRYGEAILEHRLRREIIATVTANSIVNRLGVTFVHDVTEETGQPAGNIARCYAAARELFGLRGIWNAIEALDNQVPAVLQTRMILTASELLRRATFWLLRNMEQPLKITEVMDQFGAGIELVRESLPQVLGDAEREAIEIRVEALTSSGVPEDLARHVEGLAALGSGCDIVQVAMQSGRPVEEVARAYFRVGNRLGLDRLRDQAEKLAPDDHWQRSAIDSIVEDLFGQQRALTNVVLGRANGADGEQAVEQWCDDFAAQVAQGREMLEEFDAAGGLDVAKLALANRYMRRLIVTAR